MKTILKFSLVAAIGLAACNNNQTAAPNKQASARDTASSQTPATAPAPPSTAVPQQVTAINDVVSSYLQLKNALANDNSQDAATASNALSENLKKVDASALPAGEKKVYDDMADDMKEHAEHIGGNADKIAHQREHFESLSNDLYDLVKTVKPSQALYKDFCPMYNNNKGAIWLSETKEIKNPYLGKKMSTCGEVKEEIAAQ